MTTFEIETIQAAFNRCFGLKACILSNTRGSAQALAEQTGLRLTFINEHLETIKAL